jgi:hypothetical protein
MTPSEQREAFNELAKQPGILSGTQYAEMINARLAWSDGEEGTLKLVDDHTVIVHFDETGIEVYSRYCGALENIDPICWPFILATT